VEGEGEIANVWTGTAVFQGKGLLGKVVQGGKIGQEYNGIEGRRIAKQQRAGRKKFLGWGGEGREEISSSRLIVGRTWNGRGIH